MIMIIELAGRNISKPNAKFESELLKKKDFYNHLF